MYFDFLCFTSGDKFLKFRSNTMDGSSGWGGGGGWDVGRGKHTRKINLPPAVKILGD